MGRMTPFVQFELRSRRISQHCRALATFARAAPVPLSQMATLEREEKHIRKAKEAWAIRRNDRRHAPVWKTVAAAHRGAQTEERESESSRHDSIRRASKDR